MAVPRKNGAADVDRPAVDGNRFRNDVAGITADVDRMNVDVNLAYVGVGCNRVAHTLAWSSVSGLVAFGAHNAVAIYDPAVLLTDYLRCLPAEVKTKVVDEAYVDQHNFASFNKKALDIEAKLGSAHHGPTNGRRKKLPHDWKKKGQLMFVDHDGQTTEIDEFPDLGDETEHDGASETSDGGVVSPIKEKAKGTGKKKVVRSTDQSDQGTPAWVKLGLDYEVEFPISSDANRFQQVDES
ncbi:hypothetical protein CBR_g583 [Chara braunii]|uniref:Uncharacterized protein n=1 Tax=Chara braunii TaxID=69332 RepID=A0A388KBL1_CHABU|nr:hypothetical protein CBR_g583 [Chara braunii]|eukprot:GBG67448.1 hypothetical protein CBR_g583 [Chara braunii]